MKERLAEAVPGGDKLAVVAAGTDKPVEDDVEGKQGKGDEGRAVDGYLFGAEREMEGVALFKQTEADGKEDVEDMG